MAVLGNTGVKDVYRKSTVTLINETAIGDELRIDSLNQASPVNGTFVSDISRDFSLAANVYGEQSYYSPTTQSYGNQTLPDGRVILPLRHDSVSAWKLIILEADGISRSGTDELLVTPPNSQAANGNIIFTQLGGTSDGNSWLFGYCCKGYHTATANHYQQASLVTVSKTTASIAFSTAITTYTATSGAAANSRATCTYQNLDDMHTCRGGTVFCYFAQKTSEFVYTLTARPLTSAGTLTGTASTTTFGEIDSLHSINIIPIDDANGIFLVSHEAVSGTRTLTRVDVASNGTITTLVIASIDSLYTDLDTNISRTNCMLAGEGTGSPNLCFFDVNSTESIKAQTCTYDPSDDSLTWGTYQLLSTPRVLGAKNHAFWLATIEDLRHTWTYSPAYKTIYINFPHSDGLHGEGVAFNIDAMTISAARLGIADIPPYTQSVYAVNQGTRLVIQPDAHAGAYALHHVAAVDTGLLVTASRSAVALEAGVIGDIINVALVDGVTFTEALPASFYLEKEGYYFQYQAYEDSGGIIESGSIPAARTIKTIQRGIITFTSTINERTVSINRVERDKSTYAVYGGATYSLQSSFISGHGASPWIEVLSDSSIKIVVSANPAAQGSATWEVVEYV